MENKQNKMAVMPMPRLLANMSLPLMVSLLVQSLYNIVDSIFVSRVSERALAATSLAFPVQMLMIAVAVGTAVGVNALLSRSIGAGRTEMVRSVAATGALLAFGAAVVFGLTGFLFGRDLAAGFAKGDEEIGRLCGQYLSICMTFCLGTFTETMFQRFLQAAGDTFRSMLSLVAGAVTNLILDPILIFGCLGLPALGIRGAAIATVIGQWVGAGVAVALNAAKNPAVPVSFRGYRPQAETFKGIYKVGLPTIITQAMGSVMMVTVNGVLLSASATAVAFFGVYYKLQSFLYMPMNGLGQAAIPIVGYNLGAGNYDRIRQVYRTALPVAVGVALCATALFNLFPRALLGLFAAGEDMLKLGVPALRIISVTFPLASATMILGYAASGLGNGLLNMCATALRQIVVLLPVLLLIARTAGVSYVWFAFWVSEGTACAFAVLMTRRELKRKLAAG